MTVPSGGDLFSWHVLDPAGRRVGPGGAGADPRRAMEELARALVRERPGSRGAVWAVRLVQGRQGTYDYGGLVAQGFHDPESGEVTVESPEPPRSIVLRP
ncbi:hypothetical protein [Actinomadura sediminis]|uniref:Uncharacterized protein n=1 Tax=Actinomadura sediminis TaxID=1038904 RepID=A0ABW3EV61_9ACTN